jgi:hypothetical protein
MKAEVPTLRLPSEQAASKIAKRGAGSIMMVPTAIKGGPAGPLYAPLNAHRDAALSLASANS